MFHCLDSSHLPSPPLSPRNGYRAAELNLRAGCLKAFSFVFG